MTTHSRFFRAFGAVLLAGCGAPEPTFQVRETVQQLYVTHAEPGATLEVSRNGTPVTTGVADERGSLVVRNLEPGSGYVVKVQGAKEQTRALTVKSIESSTPKADLYTGQTLKEGFNYLTMRDGTTLSAWVTLPKGKGPFPTVVNYSGYDPSQPGLPPSESLLYLAQGYVVVGVNMRGTGCSGGACNSSSWPICASSSRVSRADSSSSRVMAKPTCTIT